MVIDIENLKINHFDAYNFKKYLLKSQIFPPINIS